MLSQSLLLGAVGVGVHDKCWSGLAAASSEKGAGASRGAGKAFTDSGAVTARSRQES